MIDTTVTTREPARSLIYRVAVFAYGVAAYLIGVAALLAVILMMLGVFRFTGGPLGGSIHLLKPTINGSHFFKLSRVAVAAASVVVEAATAFLVASFMISTAALYATTSTRAALNE